LSNIVGFSDEDAVKHDLVGGKGANLGRLVEARFPVPPGFTVSVGAYREFMEAAGLKSKVLELIGSLDFERAGDVETAMADFRRELVEAPVPASLEEEISAAHAEYIEDGARVAVRSSGTAEDLADASFAGMHDTYLDILGAEAVIDAVKRCWASLWTTRATTYRQNKDFDQGEVALAVVVQTMVSSEVSGVMFTANPLTTNTDEIVINASWGLGEAIVSGIVTPDEFILSRRTLKVRRSVVADKHLRIVREDEGGTRTEDVPEDIRNAPCLDERQLARLGELGERVMSYYDGLPQDTEWAMADDEFYLLQSRDVTGVEFTWDEDVDADVGFLPPFTQYDPEDNDDILWTNAWAREFWNGAITPLFYTIRGRNQEYCDYDLHALMGMPESRDMRLMKYRRGTAYYNTKADAEHYSAILPKALRAGAVGNIHPDDQQAYLDKPFDVKRFLQIMARMQFLEPGHSWTGWFKVIYPMVEDTRGPGDPKGYGAPPEFFAETGGLHGKTAEELGELSDAELIKHTGDRVNIAAYFNVTLWDGFFVYASITLSGLGWMLANWAHDVDPSTFQALISGLPERTKAAEESHDLWSVAMEIKNSPKLTSLFDENEGMAFFEAAEVDPEGQQFIEKYREFVELHGHRGHADRDIWYARRSENPALDYPSFRANMMSDEGRSPEAVEGALVTKREETTERLVEELKKQPLGSAKATLFQTTLSYIHRFLKLRDDERWAIDIITLSKKRCVQEISKRLVERGQLVEADDFYFLTLKDLFDMLESGKPAGRLEKAQIAGRRRAFQRVLDREDDAPMYLRGDMPLAEASAGSDGVLLGVGTSKGQVTGTARVVPSLEQIGRVEKDEILICNSTDPGWASVFLIIKGLVIETGGMLAHGSCLSREYGLPAVTLASAMRHIPDGATITVNGDTGEITVLDNPQSEDDAAAVEDPAKAAA
jgi:phosphohistidine swiveling domain-containing protein